MNIDQYYMNWDEA